MVLSQQKFTFLGCFKSRIIEKFFPWVLLYWQPIFMLSKLRKSNGKNRNLKHNIKNWWSNFPMTYGDEHGNLNFHENVTITPEFRSKNSSKNQMTHFIRGIFHYTEKRKFANLFDYESYKNRKVLESRLWSSDAWL